MKGPLGCPLPSLEADALLVCLQHISLSPVLPHQLRSHPSLLSRPQTASQILKIVIPILRPLLASRWHSLNPGCMCSSALCNPQLSQWFLTQLHCHSLSLSLSFVKIVHLYLYSGINDCGQYMYENYEHRGLDYFAGLFCFIFSLFFLQNDS